VKIIRQTAAGLALMRDETHQLGDRYQIQQLLPLVGREERA
jgi:hypothetical protein